MIDKSTNLASKQIASESIATVSTNVATDQITSSGLVDVSSNVEAKNLPHSDIVEKGESVIVGDNITEDAFSAETMFGGLLPGADGVEYGGIRHFEKDKDNP